VPEHEHQETRFARRVFYPERGGSHGLYEREGAEHVLMFVCEVQRNLSAAGNAHQVHGLDAKRLNQTCEVLGIVRYGPLTDVAGVVVELRSACCTISL
jgi:hypothetical protein